MCKFPIFNDSGGMLRIATGRCDSPHRLGIGTFVTDMILLKGHTPTVVKHNTSANSRFNRALSVPLAALLTLSLASAADVSGKPRHNRI
jgi:hypothetical protein